MDILHRHQTFQSSERKPTPVIEHDELVYINDLNVFIQYGGCCSDQTLQLSLNKHLL